MKLFYFVYLSGYSGSKIQLELKEKDALEALGVVEGFIKSGRNALRPHEFVSLTFIKDL